RNRSGAGLPLRTSLAENRRLKNFASPVVSRLARTRSGGEDDATHFGPRSQVSAWAACGMARRSARKRASVAAARVAPKLTGSLRRVGASLLASMSGGRRPGEKRVTSSGGIRIPPPATSSAAAAAAICSLSTNTPLQSKMITGASRQRAYGTALVSCCSTNRGASNRNRAHVAKVGRREAGRFFYTVSAFLRQKTGMIVHPDRKWPEKRLV